MEQKKIKIAYATFNKSFYTWNQGYVIEVNEADADALKDILKRNGYGIINF